MRGDILATIIENAKKNSLQKLTDAEIIKMVEETEKELGYELTGYGIEDCPYRQFHPKDTQRMTLKNNQKVGMYAYNEALKNHNKVAYIVGDKKILYEELAHNILVCAKRLKTLGVKKGDKIAMSCLSTPEVVYLFFAANLLGLIVRPLDPIASEEYIIEEINRTDSVLYVTNDFNFIKQQSIVKRTHLKKVIALSADEFLPQMKNKESIFFAAISRLSRLAIKVSSFCSKWMTWDQYNSIPVNDENIEQVAEPYEEGSTIAIFSTSGSTGKAKGVNISDSNLMSSILKQMMSNFNVGNDENIYNPMPTCSSYFWDDVLLAIAYGATTTLEPLFNEEKSPEAILGCEASIILSGPIIIERLIQYIDKYGAEKFKNHPMKHIISGGDLLDWDIETRANKVLQRINPFLKVENALGTSETTGPAFIPNGIIDNPRAYRPGSVGIILPGDVYGIFAYDKENESRDLDMEGFNRGLRYYEIGEICYKVENPVVFGGYYNDKESTENAIKMHTDGTIWYHSGDLGYMDPAGFQYCSGRKNGLIVRAGHKIWASKIENVVMTFKKIEDCAVIGVPDDREKEVPVLFIQFDKSASEEEKKYLKAAIETRIAQKLDIKHVPTFMWELDEVPRNSMLKAKISVLFSIHQTMLKQFEEISKDKTMLLRRKGLDIK